jgi:signal transduction histidine kinase
VGFKLIGIALTAMLFPAAGLLYWLLNSHSLLEMVFLDNARLNELIALVFVMTLVGLYAAHLLIGLLTHPIREIALVARRVDQGDLYQRAPVWANDEIGELGRAFNAMIDTLARAQSDLELSNEQLRAGNDDLSMLYKLAAMTNQSVDIELILEAGLQRALEASGTRTGLVALIGEQEQLVVHAQNNVPAELQRRLTEGNARAVLVELAKRDNPQFVATAEVVPSSDELKPVFEQWGYCTSACLPIKSRNKLQGILITLGSEPHPANERTEALLMAVCNQLGTAVDNASLWEELKRKEAIRARLLAQTVTAQEQERERISRELHDETGQALTALLVQLKVLERLPDINAVSALAHDLRELVVQTLEEVRRLARDLRPSTLDDLGLVPTLEWYVKAYRQKTSLNVEFIVNVPDRLRLPRLTELILYRVVQEALTNVARHARASYVRIELEQRNDTVRLTVKDDGCGFDVAKTLDSQERSLGLLGMHERVELIGATLQLESIPGKGTCVQVEVSLDESVETAASC